MHVLQKTHEFKKYFQPVPKQEIHPKYNMLWKPQRKFAEHILYLKRIIGAIEMRAGKTLGVFAAIDTIQPKRYFWFASKSALRALHVQLNKWQPLRTPDIIDTYASMSKHPNLVGKGTVVVFDESMALKNITSKRTQEAIRIASEAEYVILLTGTPTPKNFLDWYSQCEVAQPGLVKEKNKYKFQERYGIVDPLYFTVEEWIQEEIDKFPARVGKLIHTYYRKDLERNYDVEFIRVDVPHTDKTVSDKAIEVTINGSVLQVLNQLRQLSDGFLYKSKVSVCHCVPRCCENRDLCFDEEPPFCASCMHKFYLKCSKCDGAGLCETKYSELYNSDKLVTLKYMLKQIKRPRVVIYVAFIASINRVAQAVEMWGWDVIQIDGRGIKGGTLDDFQGPYAGKIAVVAHPACGGEGIDLSAADTIIYYSNTFKASERWQSQDRCLHINNKVKIYDLIYLSTDAQILDNLQQKRDAQEMTLEQIRNGLLTATS